MTFFFFDFSRDKHESLGQQRKTKAEERVSGPLVELDLAKAGEEVPGLNKHEKRDDNPEAIEKPKVEHVAHGVLAKGNKLLVSSEPLGAKGHVSTIELADAEEDLEEVSMGEVLVDGVDQDETEWATEEDGH